MAAPNESYVAPAPQPVEQAEVARPPTLVSGRVQPFRGYLTRRTTIVKRWKENWIEIEPGKKLTANDQLTCTAPVGVRIFIPSFTLALALRPCVYNKLAKYASA